MAVLTNTTAKRNAWIEWLDHCRGGSFTNQLFFGKTIGGVADVWAPAIVAFEMALRAGGYTPRSAWAYNFRGIAGATCTCTNFSRCSLHGGQGAIDIDPRENPFKTTTTFRWSDTAFTPAQIALIEGIRNTKNEQLWFWGGRWNSIKDYMHFEPNVDPGSTDVDWSTVPGNLEGVGVNITPRSSALHIAELQKIMAEEFALNNGTWSPLSGKSTYDGQSFKAGQDGDWGSTCTANVKAMQKKLSYPQNGSLVDDFLWQVIAVRNYGGGTAVDLPAVDLSDYYTRSQVYNKAQADGRFVNIGEDVKIVK